MSNRYKGGVISATPPTTTGGESGTASGAWTLEQQMQAQAAGLWPLQPTGPYIEDVFSTWLYTGNNSTQTITNGIDLSTNGGLVWLKGRNTVGTEHELTDTARGTAAGGRALNSNDTQPNQPGDLTSFTSSGFGLSYNTANGNATGTNYVSWTFRKQPKFFDVVTFTTDSSGAATVSHALGSTPAFVIVKRTDSTGLWLCWHTSLPSINYYLFLNLTNAQTNSGGTWLTPTSTQVSFPSNTSTGALDSSASYVMYVYASNAGGFGLTGTDNVISCGSYAGNGSFSNTITLGYEPQWVMIKKATSPSGINTGWVMFDNMRGMGVVGTAPSPFLYANASDAESSSFSIGVTATGFQLNTQNTVNTSGDTYIYIAIRRGPMKVPTTGTSVFLPVTQTAAGTVTTGFPVDLAISGSRTITGSKAVLDRLRGSSTNSYAVLFTNSTGAEGTGTGAGFGFDNNTGYVDAFWSSSSMAYWNFRRAPGFFDEVCYTGTGVARTVTHNLTVVPELMIVKGRSAGTAGSNWSCYHSALGNTQVISLNEDIQAYTNSQWNNTTPTASVFSVGTQTNVNGSGQTYVAYLFATCSGVSKVGSYTGTATTKQIDCGFTGGARFVLIKRTDEVASGNPWYVWDSARGIVSGNDPYLLLNSTAAEVTGTNYVDTDSTGFKVTASAPAGLNANGGTYIFLAIA